MTRPGTFDSCTPLLLFHAKRAPVCVWREVGKEGRMEGRSASTSECGYGFGEMGSFRDWGISCLGNILSWRLVFVGSCGMILCLAG